MSSLSNSTTRHARFDALDTSNVSCRDVTSEVECGLYWLLKDRALSVGHLASMLYLGPQGTKMKPITWCHHQTGLPPGTGAHAKGFMPRPQKSELDKSSQLHDSNRDIALDVDFTEIYHVEQHFTPSSETKFLTPVVMRCYRSIRLRNDLYCVWWGVKLYSLTHCYRSWYHQVAVTDRHHPLC